MSSSLVRSGRRLAQRLACLGLVCGLGSCAQNQAGPAPETAPTPVQTGGSDAAPADASDTTLDPQQTGASVFVLHQVDDFDAFMKFFEEGAPEREAMGVRGQLVSRLDDGRVIIHFIADDAERIDAALKSKRMDSYLNREGAPGASIIWLAHNEIVRMPAVPPSGQTYSLLLKLPVTDFAAFKRGFSQRHQVFAEQSVIGEGLHSSAIDDNVAILHFVGTDRAKLEALPRRPEFGELLTIAGYTEPLKPLVAVDIARSRGPAPPPSAAPPPSKAPGTSP